jgi:hypothetical protein
MWRGRLSLGGLLLRWRLRVVRVRMRMRVRVLWLGLGLVGATQGTWPGARSPLIATGRAKRAHARIGTVVGETQQTACWGGRPLLHPGCIVLHFPDLDFTLHFFVFLLRIWRALFLFGWLRLLGRRRRWWRVCGGRRWRFTGSRWGSFSWWRSSGRLHWCWLRLQWLLGLLLGPQTIFNPNLNQPQLLLLIAAVSFLQNLFSFFLLAAGCNYQRGCLLAFSVAALSTLVLNVLDVLFLTLSN